MKIHRPLIEALVTGLDQTFNVGQPADKVLEKLFKQSRQLGGRDRRWIAENFYSAVRWWRPLVEKQTGSWRDFHHDYTEADVRGIVDLLIAHNTQPESAQSLSQLGSRSRASQQSIPDWLDKVGEGELGTDWEPFLQAMNAPAKVYLRVNTLRTNILDLRSSLKHEEIETETVPNVETALVLKERKNVFQTEAYKKGWFEVQDAGSQLIAPFLKPEAKMRAVDACAGAGGKALHLATLMRNSGRVVAMDIHEWKLKELRTRSTRAGLDTIEVKVADSKTVKRMADSADRVLLDVPCSGLGVIKRHPGTKWYLQPDELEVLRKTQAEILSDYSVMVKKDGLLVYATCSILPSENQKQVEKFLTARPEFSLEDELKVSPFETLFDGFYAARLKRNSF
ncbi:MAG: methyltransferase domain-containing protein [Bdellovibrionota bacterium]